MGKKFHQHLRHWCLSSSWLGETCRWSQNHVSDAVDVCCAHTLCTDWGQWTPFLYRHRDANFIASRPDDCRLLQPMWETRVTEHTYWQFSLVPVSYIPASAVAFSYDIRSGIACTLVWWVDLSVFILLTVQMHSIANCMNVWTTGYLSVPTIYDPPLSQYSADTFLRLYSLQLSPLHFTIR